MEEQSAVAKARNKWLKEGDSNSRYFHDLINRRRKRNEIIGIDINGEWCEEVSDVKSGIFEFFKIISRRMTL